MVVVLVLLCAVLAGAIGGLIFHFAHRQDATATSTQVLTVGAPPTLTADVDAGSVRVVAGRTGEVHVTVTKRAANASTDDARHDLALIGVDVHQVGEDIAVTARVPATSDPGLSLAAEITLTVPQRSRIAIHLGRGDAQLDGLSGDIAATLTSGDLDLTNVTLLDQSTLDVRDGDVKLMGTVEAGAAAEIHVERGDVAMQLARTDPVSVSAATLRGDVTLTGWDATPVRSGDGASISGIAGEKATPGTTPPGSLFISIGAGDISIHVG